MNHIHVDIASDTPPEKLLVLAKYCLLRVGIDQAEMPPLLAKATGSVRRRVRRPPPPPATFDDPGLEYLWRQVAPWGTHWWLTVAPLLDNLLAQDHAPDDVANWSRVAHVLHLAGQAFSSHMTGLQPHGPHEDLQLFWHDHLLPPHLHNCIAQACMTGMEYYERQQLGKAWSIGRALSAVEQAAIHYAQRAAGAVLQPILAGVQARIARRLLQQERQAVQQRVPEAIAQRQSPRRLASLLADDAGNWQRDLERIARTELQDAYSWGAMATLIASHSHNQVRMPDGTTTPSLTPTPPPVQVFRIPAHTACDHCRDLYINTDGTPHLYPIQEVLSNPSNYGVPAEQWVAQIGSTHPSCLCSIWQEYVPALHGPLFASMAQSTLQKATRRLQGRVHWHGLDISIEYTPGMVRSGVAPDGTPWHTTMCYSYGYIRRSEGVDGDQVDVYLGHDVDAPMVYCITTRTPPDFQRNDEDKCMLGFSSLEAAQAAFLAHYDDPRFLGKITPMPFAEFRDKVLATADHPRLIRSRNPA